MATGNSRSSGPSAVLSFGATVAISQDGPDPSSLMPQLFVPPARGRDPHRRVEGPVEDGKHTEARTKGAR
jgi:hypothetical protein